MAVEDEQPKHQRKGSEDPPSVIMLFTEIIVEILTRLPVDSLLRCRSVCKSWRSLISDPHFVRSHLAKSTSNYNRHQLMFCAGPTIRKRCRLSHVFYDNFMINASDLYCPAEHIDLNDKVVGSCNGLICMIDVKFGLSIWNPSTRMFNIIPNCNDQFGLFWNYQYGFGYQVSTDNYKFVKFSCNVEDTTKCVTFAKIYSLKDGSWKEIGFPCEFRCYYNFYGKFSNGALHWSAKKESNFWTILSLDLETETYGEILLPENDAGNKRVILGSLGELLCVFYTYHGIRTDLWVMKDYGVKESWAKLVSFPYSFRTSIPWMDLVSVPFCISNDGKLLFRSWTKMIVYDFKTGSISEIPNTDCFEACTFVESLVSPMPETSLGDRN